jgi:hypothetical protein
LAQYAERECAKMVQTEMHTEQEQAVSCL